MFDYKYEKLTTREREDFANTVNLLFTGNYILRDIYSDKEKGTVFNPAYRFIERH